MIRWPIILSTTALVLAAGVLGWSLGRIPTETEIMNKYVGHYLFGSPETAQATDCFAVPGEGDIRMVITCTPDDGPEWVFKVGKRGQFIEGKDIPGLST